MKSSLLIRGGVLCTVGGLACSFLSVSSPIQAQPQHHTSPGQSMRIGKEGVRALYGIASQRFEGSAEDAARGFLASRRSSLRLDSLSTSLVTSRVEHVPGGTHVRFSQMYRGISVYHGEIVVSVNEANEVGMLVSTTRPEIRVTSLTPAFSTARALALARSSLSARTPALGGSEQIALTIYRMPGGEDRLAYRVDFVLEDPPGDWELIIDAQSGKVLLCEDRYVNRNENSTFSQGSGLAYLRNPLSAARRHYGDPGFVNNNNADSDSLDAYRSPVTLDSLAFEDGFYRLSGPSCVITDLESPLDTLPYRETSPDGFRYRRSQQGFEAVMAYYHVTLAHQHVRALGFDPPGLRSLRVDPHGYQGKDNSHYSPGGNWIAFGTGGVEDAEDADVIWHEYGHAIQYNIVPFWGGGECAALGEGFGDYWAGSYARSLPEWTAADPEYQWVFGWDGHNPYWSGRILNDAGAYPFPAGSVHIAGQIWASALIGIRDDLGRDITDRLVIKSLYYLGPEVTATDNAQAIVQADRDLYGGAHLPTLMYWLQTAKNFLPVTGAYPILLVNDETPSSEIGAAMKGIDSTVSPPRLLFSSVLPSLPLADGLAIQSTTFAGFDTSMLSSVRVLVLLGGSNPAPFNDAAKRQAIIRFVEGGGKVLIEGGDVGSRYRWRADGGEADSAFRTAVLHSHAFRGDGQGAALLPPAADSPIFTQPHRLDAPLAFISGFAAGDRDCMEALNGTNTLTAGTWSDESGTGAVIVHLDDAGSVQTLYLPFSLSSLADSSVASQFAENALSFLLYYQHQMTGVAPLEGPLPSAVRLHQNYPNPFNPTTTFAFDLAERSRIRLEVFTVLGQSVSVVAEGDYPPGRHELHWDAASQRSQLLSSGIYLFRLTTEGRDGRKESACRMMAIVR